MPSFAPVPEDHPAWSAPIDGAFDVMGHDPTGELFLRAANADNRVVWVYPGSEGVLRHLGAMLLSIADELELVRRNRRAGLN